MEKTKHTEYIREIPGSKTVILFVHGILGTPDHFNRLITAVPENWSVYNILLEGHGKTTEDFAAATMEQWKMQVHRLILKLSKEYEKIMIAAHSMGTLFAIEEARRNPKVKALFLLNVPLKIWVKPGIIATAFKIIFDKVKPEDSVSEAVRRAYSIAPDRRLWKYTGWIPNYLALFSEIRETRKKINRIQTPCFVFQSKKDELVAVSSVKYFIQNPKIRWGMLKHSGHFYYEASDMEFMIQIFRRVCEKVRKSR
ncbi:MAG: alpha/beta hydrolase [Clostridiales bacterium]|nr:alpha/beta hydrolase [Clostridiales bacterium]